MPIVADLHIHSHYSRATSKDLDFEHLTRWAMLKGVGLVGTGDISHPGWLQEMRDRLEPAEAGLFRLKPDLMRAVEADVPPACRQPVRFMLAGEISNIYKKGGKVRKVHNVIFAPSFSAVEKVQAALERIGNIRSDGRPILGLDSRDLLEIILGVDPQCYLIPAHIWTPWFSMLGSMSGFDSVEECFADLTPHIFALETGLSSDPPMNWRVSGLDGYALVSNSDAHSPPKLAREATVFDTELTYPAIFDALKSRDPRRCLGTLEFFPEEGKYHYDGHRKCEVRWEPTTTRAHGGLCVVCGKPVTIGVMSRVEALADRPPGACPPDVAPCQNLIPLPEVLAEVWRVGAGSRRVEQAYQSLLARLGPELTILRETPLEEIERVGGGLLAEGVRRMRAGEVSIAAGYDGDYGVIKLFGDDERGAFSPQIGLFQRQTSPPIPLLRGEGGRTPPSLVGNPQAARGADGGEGGLGSSLLTGLNPQQQVAVLCTETPLIIVAGPGTGKTRTLTHRIAYLVAVKGVDPSHILAITFTNKAAEEMAGRLAALLGPDVVQRMTIKTFHAFGALILREAGHHLGLAAPFSILSEADRLALLRQVLPDKTERGTLDLLEAIVAAKNGLLRPDMALPEGFPLDPPDFQAVYRAYNAALRAAHALDYDDLALLPVTLFETCPDVLAAYRQRFRWVSVDEYQDINLAQYRLLKLLTAGGAVGLCAIGDPDQAIYSFRGADRAYFLRFRQDFPNAQQLALSQNYRSTQLILDASAQVIARSSEGQASGLWSETLDPAKIEIVPTATDKAEAETVVHTIEQMVGGTSLFSLDSGRVTDSVGAEGGGRGFSDFAVLYRLSAQSAPLIEAFHRSGIPFQTVGQTPLAEQPAVRRVLALLWLAVVGPTSTVHLAEAMGKKGADFDRLIQWAATQEMSISEAVHHLDGVKGLSPAFKSRLREVLTGVDALRAEVGAVAAAALVERAWEMVARLDPDSADPEVQEQVEMLRLRAVSFDIHLADFLEATALQRETDAYDPRADRVTLMTLHASKGLEFPVVFIVGCEEGLLPYTLGKTVDIEEERRLFYVGMTRAQQRLVLTHSRSRFLYGQRLAPVPSRFLSDIEERLKELRAQAMKPRETPDSVQLKLF